MAEQIKEIFNWGRFGPPIHPDPALLLEAVLGEIDSRTQKQIAGLYFEAVAATLQANLKFVQGVQAVLAVGQE